MRSQLKNAENILRQLLNDVFGAGKPADRVLSDLYRRNHQYGSRDRQLYSETVFAFFRYWGFLRKFLPAETRTAIEAGNISISGAFLRGLMFAALYIDQNNLPMADFIAKELNLAWPRAGALTPLERALALNKSFGSQLEFALEDLVPAELTAFLPPALDREQWLQHLMHRPPMWIRVQGGDQSVIDKLRLADLTVTPHPTLPGAAAISDAKVNLYNLEEFRNGLFEVQDFASQCIGVVAAPDGKMRVLDCCAGAGGKSLQMAELMGRKGTLVASDIRSYKLEDLRKRARRAGFPNIVTKEWDGKAYLGKNAAKFDLVLVDAPCSCSGVWRRNPESRWTLKTEEITEIAALQLQILTNAATAVRPGGVLVYATCSMFPVENEDVVQAFLAAQTDYYLDSFPHPFLPGETVRDGMLQVNSYDADCDSMFVARLRRRHEI